MGKLLKYLCYGTMMLGVITGLLFLGKFLWHTIMEETLLTALFHIFAALLMLILAIIIGYLTVGLIEMTLDPGSKLNNKMNEQTKNWL